MTGAEFLVWSTDITFLMLIGGMVLGLFRLIRGPTLADRVVALDMMTVLIVAFCGVFAISSNDRAFLDVALVLALVGFLATVALARFAERRYIRRDRDKDGQSWTEGTGHE